MPGNINFEAPNYDSLKHLNEEQLADLNKRKKDSIEAAYGGKPFIENYEWLTANKVSPEEYTNFLDAYKLLYPIIKSNNNPNLQSGSILEKALKEKGLSSDQIKNALHYRGKIIPYVDAELGNIRKNSNVGHTFNDEFQKALYLKARGFSKQDLENEPVSGYPDLSYDNIKKLGLKDTEITKQFFAQEEANKKAQEEKIKKEKKERTPNLTEDDFAPVAEAGPKYKQKSGKYVLEELIKKHANGPEPYKEPRLANFSKKELESRQQHEALNPSLPKNREILEDVKGKLKRSSEEKSISAASKPYLYRSNQNLTDLHDDLYGKIENDYDKSILDKAERHWKEKVAPSIQQKYLTPGVRGHGHIAKEVGDAYEKIMRGATESILGHRAQNRAQSIQAVQGEKETALKGANIAGTNAREDALHNMKATEALQDIQTLDETKKRAHAEQHRSLGKEERELEQQQKDIAYQDFKENRDEEKDALAAIHNATTPYPTATLMSRPAASNPVRPINTMEATAGNLLVGAGTHLLGKKTGGRVRKAGGGMIMSNHLSPNTKAKLLSTIHSYKKLAKGGSVDEQTDQSDVIQDAVFDGTDVGAELSRQNRRKVLQQAKQNYANYADGGAVNPIVQGATMAKDLVERDKALREQEMQIRERIVQSYKEPEPEPENKWIGALSAGMKAAATSGNDDFLARGAKTYTTTMDDISSKKDKKAAAQKEARKEQAAFAKQLHDERMSREGHELKQQEFGETKRLHNAQIGHYGAHNRLLDAQSKKLLQESNSGLIDGMDPGDMPTKKLTKDDEKSIDQSEAAMAAIDATFTAAEKLLEETNKINSGPGVALISKFPWLGPKIAGIATDSDIDAIQNYKADTTSYLEQSTKAETVLKENGGRYLAAQQKVKENAKPSLDYSQEKNKSLMHTDLSDKLNFYNIQIDRMKRHGSPANRIKNAINKRDKYAEIVSKIKNISPNKENKDAAEEARYHQLKRQAGG